MWPTKETYQQIVILEVFSKNGYQIRIQRKKLCISTLVNFVFGHLWKKRQISWLITLKTHENKVFQALGVSKNDFSWSKTAWSIFQSLFWLEKQYFWTLQPTETLKMKPTNRVFLMDGWKLCQKMRLDALTIFLIEWRHHASYLGSKRSKYWGQTNVTRSL